MTADFFWIKQDHIFSLNLAIKTFINAVQAGMMIQHWQKTTETGCDLAFVDRKLVHGALHSLQIVYAGADEYINVVSGRQGGKENVCSVKFLVQTYSSKYLTPHLNSHMNS